MTLQVHRSHRIIDVNEHYYYYYYYNHLWQSHKESSLRSLKCGPAPDGRQLIGQYVTEEFESATADALFSRTILLSNGIIVQILQCQKNSKFIPRLNQLFCPMAGHDFSTLFDE